jgi:hypothetical protein
VFSVDSVEEARKLIRTVSNKQYVEHPLIPGDDWYKIDLGLSIQELELSDLPAVQNKLSAVYDLLKREWFDD